MGRSLSVCRQYEALETDEGSKRAKLDLPVPFMDYLTSPNNRHFFEIPRNKSLRTKQELRRLWINRAYSIKFTDIRIAKKLGLFYKLKVTRQLFKEKLSRSKTSYIDQKSRKHYHDLRKSAMSDQPNLVFEVSVSLIHKYNPRLLRNIHQVHPLTTAKLFLQVNTSLLDHADAKFSDFNQARQLSHLSNLTMKYVVNKLSKAAIIFLARFLVTRAFLKKLDLSIESMAVDDVQESFIIGLMNELSSKEKLHSFGLALRLPKILNEEELIPLKLPRLVNFSISGLGPKIMPMILERLEPSVELVTLSLDVHAELDLKKMFVPKNFKIFPNLQHFNISFAYNTNPNLVKRITEGIRLALDCLDHNEYAHLYVAIELKGSILDFFTDSFFKGKLRKIAGLKLSLAHDAQAFIPKELIDCISLANFHFSSFRAKLRPENLTQLINSLKGKPILSLSINNFQLAEINQAVFFDFINLLKSYDNLKELILFLDFRNQKGEDHSFIFDGLRNLMVSGLDLEKLSLKLFCNSCEDNEKFLAFLDSITSVKTLKSLSLDVLLKKLSQEDQKYRKKMNSLIMMFPCLSESKFHIGII